MAKSKTDKLLEQIAQEHLHVETLERRWGDEFDFHDCSVWGIKAALEAAYNAGLATGKIKSKGDRGNENIGN